MSLISQETANKGGVFELTIEVACMTYKGRYELWLPHLWASWSGTRQVKGYNASFPDILYYAPCHSEWHTGAH